MPKLRQEVKQERTKSFAAEACYMQLLEIVKDLTARVEVLEQTAQRRHSGVSIQKVEPLEVMPEKQETREWGTEAEKLQCMINAVKILPPNMIKDGRHSTENVNAICPFKVTEDLMDLLYSNFSH